MTARRLSHRGGGGFAAHLLTMPLPQTSVNHVIMATLVAHSTSQHKYNGYRNDVTGFDSRQVAHQMRLD